MENKKPRTTGERLFAAILFFAVVFVLTFVGGFISWLIDSSAGFSLICMISGVSALVGALWAAFS